MQIFSNMKHLPFYTLAALILFIIYRRADTVTAHACGFTHCPYNGLSGPQSHRLNMALNEAGTDAAGIDSLHIIHPAASYDQLDSLLFSNQ